MEEENMEPARKMKKVENGRVDVKPRIKIITPADPKQRGCQLSVLYSLPIDKVHVELEKRGVVVSIS